VGLFELWGREPAVVRNVLELRAGKRQCRRIGLKTQARRKRRLVEGGEMKDYAATVLARIIVSTMFLTAAQTGSAQWLNYPSLGLPRTAEGHPDLTAPTPRTADGTADLSGVWQPASDPNGVAGGVEGQVAPRYMIDITKDLNPDLHGRARTSGRSAAELDGLLDRQMEWRCIDRRDRWLQRQDLVGWVRAENNHASGVGQ
jgi:hypothetical protein